MRSMPRLERVQVRERPHRFLAVPALRRFADQPEQLAFRARDLGELDHAPRVEFGVEVGVAAALADFPAHDDFQALGGEARDVGVVRLGPVGDVLEAGVPGVEERLVHRRHVVPLLHELDLQRAGIRERDRHFDRLRFAAIAEVLHRHARRVEERPDAERLAPVAHRRLDVLHDVAVLSHLPEKSAHLQPLRDHFTNKFGSQVENPGTNVTIRSATVSDTMNGQAPTITFSSGIRPTFATMYRLIPTGGVSRPIIKFSTTTTPRWTGSTPACVRPGVMIGARSRIAGSGSRIVPTTSRMTFAMMRSTHGSFDRPSRNSVASAGMRSTVSTHAKR